MCVGLLYVCVLCALLVGGVARGRRMLPDVMRRRRGRLRATIFACGGRVYVTKVYSEQLAQSGPSRDLSPTIDDDFRMRSTTCSIWFVAPLASSGRLGDGSKLVGRGGTVAEGHTRVDRCVGDVPWSLVRGETEVAALCLDQRFGSSTVTDNGVKGARRPRQAPVRVPPSG